MGALGTVVAEAVSGSAATAAASPKNITLPTSEIARAHGLLHQLLREARRYTLVQTVSRTEVTYQSSPRQTAFPTKHKFNLPAADHAWLIPRVPHHVPASPGGKKAPYRCGGNH